MRVICKSLSSTLCKSLYAFILISQWKHFKLFEHSYLSTDFKTWITFKFFSLMSDQTSRLIKCTFIYILLLIEISWFLAHLISTSLGTWNCPVVTGFVSNTVYSYYISSGYIILSWRCLVFSWIVLKKQLCVPTV